ENLVIIQNPTLWNSPNKSNFTPDQVNSDDTVGTETMEEVTEFLETFFASYPTATQQELTYYVKNNALPVIEKDYTFSELINPVFQENDNQIKVWVTVKYLDEATKAIQLSQYELTLEKDTNWLIVEKTIQYVFKTIWRKYVLFFIFSIRNKSFISLISNAFTILSMCSN